MKQYSHIVADSICDYHIVGGSLTHPAHMGVFFMGSELQTMNGQNKLNDPTQFEQADET